MKANLYKMQYNSHRKPRPRISLRGRRRAFDGAPEDHLAVCEKLRRPASMTKPRRTTSIVPGCLRAGNVLFEKVEREDAGKFNGKPVIHVADDAAGGLADGHGRSDLRPEFRPDCRARR